MEKNSAIEKIRRERESASYDRYAAIMQEGVAGALTEFCRQSEAFSRAVAQGGSFEECMKAVAKNCGKGLSDEEAYRRAVKFYLPGAKIRVHYEIWSEKNDRGGTGAPQAAPGQAAGEIIDLTAFL